jgi:Ribosome 60S biogenesis N-terminal
MLLLPAMVSLSPAVAKEVLRVISLGKDEVRRLTNRSDVPNEKSEGSSKIRKCYLHFLMAFLVDKEANTIQLVMAKEGEFSFAIACRIIMITMPTCNLRINWHFFAWIDVRPC